MGSRVCWSAENGKYKDHRELGSGFEGGVWTANPRSIYRKRKIMKWPFLGFKRKKK